MKADWRKPFRELRAGLKPLYDANLSIYHDVMLSPNRTRQELQPIMQMLEPAYSGKPLFKDIPVQTDGCSFHSHLFFADDGRGLDELGRLLYDLEAWMDKIPGGFVPAFNIPRDTYQTNRNVIRWLALVYYIAKASDAPYLDVELEYQESIHVVGFFPWYEWPQPPGCKPLDWLTHRSSTWGTIPTWIRKFEERGERLPDVIDAYLTRELIYSSLAAIDILVHVLPGERKSRSFTEEPPADLRKRRGTYDKSEKDKKELENMLLRYHNPWENENPDVNPKDPLTREEIAKERGWIGKGGEPDVTRVTRRMKLIFGKKPMDAYRKALFKAIRGPYREGLSLLHDAIVERKIRESEDGD